MPQNIYKRHENRKVTVAAGYEDEVYASVSSLSEKCQLGVIMIEEELKSNDPDAKNERCGLLADQYEIFAVVIPERPRFLPKCLKSRLIVSIDLKSGHPPVATIHGVVTTRDAYTASRRIATRHLQLVNPTWE